MKTCNICSSELPETEFLVARIVKGKTYYRKQCKECTYEIRKKRKRKIKQWFDDYKKTLQCAQCGNDDWRVLDFHHRNPDEKDFAVADVVVRGWSKKSIIDEVVKCDVLCANCHRIEHWNIRNRVESETDQSDLKTE